MLISIAIILTYNVNNFAGLVKKDVTIVTFLDQGITDEEIKKALEVYKNNKDCVVIGADTVVIANNEILGKPKDKDDVRRMITMLSNNSHIVVTGVYIVCKEYKKAFSSVTTVNFRKMTNQEIDEYCELDTIYDKAGAYAIQNEAKEFITSIDGDYYNVVGFPVEEVRKYLK